MAELFSPSARSCWKASSRLGPTVPVLAAWLSVWQVAQWAANSCFPLTRFVTGCLSVQPPSANAKSAPAVSNASRASALSMPAGPDSIRAGGATASRRARHKRLADPAPRRAAESRVSAMNRRRGTGHQGSMARSLAHCRGGSTTTNRDRDRLADELLAGLGRLEMTPSPPEAKVEVAELVTAARELEATIRSRAATPAPAAP